MKMRHCLPSGAAAIASPRCSHAGECARAPVTCAFVRSSASECAFVRRRGSVCEICITFALSYRRALCGCLADNGGRPGTRPARRRAITRLISGSAAPRARLTKPELRQKGDQINKDIFKGLNSPTASLNLLSMAILQY